MSIIINSFRILTLMLISEILLITWFNVLFFSKCGLHLKELIEQTRFILLIKKKIEKFLAILTEI